MFTFQISQENKDTDFEIYSEVKVINVRLCL